MLARSITALALTLLITIGLAVHLAARTIVDHGFGLIAIILLLASLPILSRYLD